MSSRITIAYVDDSQLNLDCIALVLADDFNVETFHGPEKFLQKFDNASYSCILTDIHMPKMDGFSLYEKIIAHPHYNGCPILFISSDESDVSRIRSFTLGAVDFISRMTRPDEMIARVKSRIQFFQSHRSIVEFENLKVNLTLLKTYLDNEEVPLTFIELKILCLVLRSYPDTVAKETVIQNIWKVAVVQDATIYTHISNLNIKLDGWSYEVISVKGKGILLQKKASIK